VTGKKKTVSETLESRYERFVPNRMRYLNLYRNDDSLGYPSHWHSVNEIEFIMPVRNDFTVMCDGKEITLKENEILIIPHGHTHSLLPAREYGERIVFVADLGLMHQFREYRSLFSFQIPLTKIDHNNSELQKEMCRCIRQLEEEYFAEKKMRNSCIYALVIQIFVMLARSSSSAAGAACGVLYPEKLAMVAEYMENHCARELTLQRVGEIFGYTKQELTDLISRYFGLSFRQWLLNVRINKAEEYLSEKHEYSIGEIALLCGYRNYNTFVHVFKEKKGCTPSEYRKNRY
jgi:AraC-like DNA-binding protein